MRTINLELDKLWDVWTSLKYYNKKDKQVNVLKNVNYHFSHKGEIYEIVTISYEPCEDLFKLKQELKKGVHKAKYLKN